MLFKSRKEKQDLDIQNLKDAIDAIKLDSNKINEKFTKEFAKLERIMMYQHFILM